MTGEEALKVWYDSVGFNEIECSCDLQESIMVAFKSLEAWGNLKNEITMLPFFNREEVINIIDKHLAEVSE